MQSLDSNAGRPVGWAHISPLRRERIEAGIKALARIDKHMQFYDWHLIGEALTDLCEAAKDQAGSNGYVGKGYNGAWARCVADNPKLAPLSKLDSATRTNAMWLAKNWDMVAPWHAELDDDVRRLVNHPATVRRRFTDDHPLPVKVPAEAADDEPDELDDDGGGDEDVFAFAPEGEEQEVPLSEDQLMDGFENYWRTIPLATRMRIAERIVHWFTEQTEMQAQPPTDGTEHVDEAEGEINRAVAKDKGRRVRALASRKAATSTSGVSQPERVAMTVAEAIANPVPRDQIFAGLGDDIGPLLPEALSEEQVNAIRSERARRRPLKDIAADFGIPVAAVRAVVARR